MAAEHLAHRPSLVGNGIAHDAVRLTPFVVFRQVLGDFVAQSRGVQDLFVPRTMGPRRPEYHPNDDDSRLSYLMEECAEVIHIGCKVQRFGWLNSNPELPPEEQKTNVQLMLHELGNASYAIDLMYRQLGARLPIPEE